MKENTILLIEDNTDVRENTAELLELSNYKVLTAQDGKEGLELARTKHPDLILCDITMPQLDGYGVLCAIQNIPDLIGTPFIFLTAKAEKKDFRSGMDLGADDYLTKPFTGEDLLRVVNKRLNKVSLLKKTFSKTIDGLNDFIKEAKSLSELINISSTQQRKKYKKKDTIFLEGDFSNFLYFIVNGKVRTYRTNYWGKEYITEILKDGDFFGYNSLIENSNHKESATAIEDSEIAIISKNDFLQLLYSNNEVAHTFIRLITNNLDGAEERLLKLAYDSARKKTVDALLFISKKYASDQKKEISFPMNRENISSIAGLSPESVSRNLTDLREEGLIDTNSNTITIIDLPKLEKLIW